MWRDLFHCLRIAKLLIDFMFLTENVICCICENWCI
ncbi:hypothetical protein X975_12268, partial [Stegodyphus mimosarum]